MNFNKAKRPNTNEDLINSISNIIDMKISKCEANIDSKISKLEVNIKYIYGKINTLEKKISILDEKVRGVYSQKSNERYLEISSDIVNYDKFSFSSNHISSDSKTKDKNIDHNGLRSKLKIEFYLQKFINNKPLHIKKKRENSKEYKFTIHKACHQKK